MELQDELLEEKKMIKNTENKKTVMEKDSIQLNCQDLDQEQNVDVNPVQLNTQNLNIIVRTDKSNYSGEITGVTYLEKNKEIVGNADILLFFGHKSKYPVYKTNSDTNGNFAIEDIPPGYYTIYARYGEKLKYISHYIKVFAGQVAQQSILLK